MHLVVVHEESARGQLQTTVKVIPFKTCLVVDQRRLFNHGRNARNRRRGKVENTWLVASGNPTINHVVRVSCVFNRELANDFVEINRLIQAAVLVADDNRNADE